MVESRPGFLVFIVSGKQAIYAFGNEAGGHRWQEYSGKKMHTSTITVAILPEPTKIELNLDERDLEWSFSRGSGPGGQHKNKTDSAVQLTHKPTGLTVRADSRS